MKYHHNKIGFINFTNFGVDGKKRYIVVNYENSEFKIFFEKLSDLRHLDNSSIYDSWFLNGNETKQIFKEKENGKNFPIISAIIVAIFNLVFESEIKLPINSVDMDFVIHTCQTREDIVNYFRALDTARLSAL